MELDHERATAKRKEIIQEISSKLASPTLFGDGLPPDELANLSEKIFDHFVRISAPEKPEMILHMITMSQGGRGGARSTKPGNILLNIQKLIAAVAGGVVTIAGAVSMPWTLPFAGLLVWDSLWSGAQRDIPEIDAAVLWTMWKHCDEDQCVPKGTLLPLVNAELQKFGRQTISQIQLEDSIGNLKNIACVQDSKQDPSALWLREWVQVNYR